MCLRLKYKCLNYCWNLCCLGEIVNACCFFTMCFHQHLDLNTFFPHLAVQVFRKGHDLLGPVECLLVAERWVVQRPHDLPTLLNNKNLFRLSQTDSMKEATTGMEAGEMVGRAKVAGFVGGIGLPLLYSPQVSFFDVFCVCPSFFPSFLETICFQTIPSVVLIYFIHLPLTCFSFFFFFLSIPHLSPSLPSNPLTPNNLSCLISSFSATFSSTIFFALPSIMCVSLFFLPLHSSLSVSLLMLSTKEVISLPQL